MGICLCLWRLAILHMHYTQSDGVIWTDRPPFQYSPWDNAGNTLTACLTVPHTLLCFCVYVAWRPNSQ